MFVRQEGRTLKVFVYIQLQNKYNRKKETRNAPTFSTQIDIHER